VKLSSERFAGVPYSMMMLASRLGMNVPELQLPGIEAIDGLPEEVGALQGQALAIRPVDRTDAGPEHIEDFAQVFGDWPEEKYKRGSAKNRSLTFPTITGPQASLGRQQDDHTVAKGMSGAAGKNKEVIDVAARKYFCVLA
jgi:hypothetical protein